MSFAFVDPSEYAVANITCASKRHDGFFQEMLKCHLAPQIATSEPPQDADRMMMA